MTLSGMNYVLDLPLWVNKLLYTQKLKRAACFIDLSHFIFVNDLSRVILSKIAQLHSTFYALAPHAIDHFKAGL